MTRICRPMTLLFGVSLLTGILGWAPRSAVAALPEGTQTGIEPPSGPGLTPTTSPSDHPPIRIDCRFAELPESECRRIRRELPPLSTLQGVVEAFGFGNDRICVRAVKVAKLEELLRSLRQRDGVMVRDEWQMVVEDGSAASFLEGAEVAVKNAEGSGEHHFEPCGMHLVCKPTRLSWGAISLTVHVEQREFDQQGEAAIFRGPGTTIYSSLKAGEGLIFLAPAPVTDKQASKGKSEAEPRWQMLTLAPEVIARTEKEGDAGKEPDDSSGLPESNPPAEKTPVPKTESGEADKGAGPDSGENNSSNSTTAGDTHQIRVTVEGLLSVRKAKLVNGILPERTVYEDVEIDGKTMRQPRRAPSQLLFRNATVVDFPGTVATDGSPVTVTLRGVGVEAVPPNAVVTLTSADGAAVPSTLTPVPGQVIPSFDDGTSAPSQTIPATLYNPASSIPSLPDFRLSDPYAAPAYRNPQPSRVTTLRMVVAEIPQSTWKDLRTIGGLGNEQKLIGVSISKSVIAKVRHAMEHAESPLTVLTWQIAEGQTHSLPQSVRGPKADPATGDLFEQRLARAIQFDCHPRSISEAGISLHLTIRSIAGVMVPEEKVKPTYIRLNPDEGIILAAPLQRPNVDDPEPPWCVMTIEPDLPPTPDGSELPASTRTLQDEVRSLRQDVQRLTELLKAREEARVGEKSGKPKDRTTADNRAEPSHADWFARTVLEPSETKPILVYFHASWCGPCKTMEPEVAAVEKCLENRSQIVRVDVDQHRDFSAQYSVKSIPQLLLFRDGKVIERREGITQASALLRLLERPEHRADDPYLIPGRE